MVTLKELAVFILASAQCHEDSWDAERKKYTVSINAAIDTVVGNQNEYTCRIISLLLHACWNDALDWSKEIAGDG